MSTEWLIDFLRQRLQRQGAESLARQLYRLLRELIRAGQLAGGAPLPASRALAAELALGRNTILNAYEQLGAEGYLESRHGSGTYVAALFSPRSAPPQRAQQHPGLSQRGQRVSGHCTLPTGLAGAFAPGTPELKQFPHAQWQRCLQNHIQRPQLDHLHYRHDGGLPELKRSLSQYLYLSRSVRCQPEQIVITQGAQQGLELLARLLADPGDDAWVEDPGYSGAQAALRAAELNIVPVPVDAQGIAPTPAHQATPPRLIYITPSHQYPTGVVMSLARRLALLQLAKLHDSWIIEDDYDSEFRYTTHPIASLQGLADSECVIYLGTFSKVMFPALGLGYLILPETLVEPFRRVQARLYREGNYQVQAALADFIEQGHFARHIKHMRELYQLRQHLLRGTLQRALGDALPLSAGEAGLHLVAQLPTGFDEWELSAAAARQQLWLRPLTKHFIGPVDRNGLVLGYAGVEEQELHAAALKLAALLETRWK
ncbi:PLP-dependent aminotransferase family protein [Chromobacterium haemolyticum]|uniref:MocR-like pyridoxine biosynthesis transcription factor PdxR n=1 Tax=Chromobacterium haemolyticum TaxID=394935 RepID=UPI00307F85B9